MSEKVSERARVVHYWLRSRRYQGLVAEALRTCRNKHDAAMWLLERLPLTTPGGVTFTRYNVRKALYGLGRCRGNEPYIGVYK